MCKTFGEECSITHSLPSCHACVGKVLAQWRPRKLASAEYARACPLRMLAGTIRFISDCYILIQIEIYISLIKTELSKYDLG